MTRRIGLVLLAAILVAGCEKKENPQTNSTSAVSSPSQAPQAQTTAVQQPQEQAPSMIGAAGPRQFAGGKAQPLVGLTWVKGGPVTITPGTVYVVEFWATWCPPCKISIPHLTNLQKKYKDKGVVFVGVSDESVDVVKPFVKEIGDTMDYNVASDTQGAVLNGYMAAFRQKGIPTAFVVDAAGKVAWFGHPLDEQFEKAIERAIAAKDVARAQG